MTLKRYELKGEHFHSTLLDSAGCWIDVSRANQQELEQLHKLYGVPKQFLNYALDANEKPRVQEAGEYTFYVLQASHAREGLTPFDTVPLAIIQTQEHIITVCEHLHTVLLDFKTGRLRGTSTEKPLVFILYILLRIAQRYVRDVQHISGKVEELEQRLEQSTHNHELLSLMRLQKSLVYFKTALKANSRLLTSLKRRENGLEQQEKDLLEEISVETEQAQDMVEIELSVLGNIMSAFGSVVSNNVNAVVRVLTLVTVLLAIPTWLTGLFGMNLMIPGQHQPWMFAIVILLNVSAVVLLWFMLRRRKWL
jgi:magnesium transporter